MTDRSIDAEIAELMLFEPNHLAWPAPEKLLEKLNKREALAYLRKRKQRILIAEQNPLYNGYVPKIWETVDYHIADLRKKFPKGVIKILIFGGHRSGKTRKASNFSNRSLVEKDGSRWWCCDSTEAQSRANQMRLMWEQFPPEWKTLERDGTTDIRYSQADGFSKNILVTPKKSEVAFKFYSMDLESLPGPELDGVWADELIPLAWVQFLCFRLANRNGTLMITFCPEFGWNETFGYFYEGATVIEDEEAPLLPKYDQDGNQIGLERLPRVMQCADPTARIIFFWTQDNPFGNYPSLVQELRSKKASREEISIRAYGLCTKAHTRAFPMFDKRWHVRDQAWFNELIKKHTKTVRYHLVDPCDGRNWFMIWVACPYPRKWIIYREWPSYDHPKAYVKGHGIPGPWALTGAAADGVKGPAQTSFGFSLERYREEIEDKEEKDEIIIARYIDSRYATSPKSDRERVTTLQEQLAEVGLDFRAMVAGKGRIIGYENNDGSVEMINSALFYDIDTEMGEYSSRYSKLNEPELIVLDTCPNTIFALKNWTGQDGQKGACKDAIDCIRGLFLTDLAFIEDDEYAFVGGGVP